MGVYSRILKRLFERRQSIKKEMEALKGESEKSGVRVRLDILDTQ